jgi:hypothetical protein
MEVITARLTLALRILSPDRPAAPDWQDACRFI